VRQPRGGVAIASGRGAAGVPFTSPRLTFFYDYDFHDAAIGFIRTKFKPTRLFMAGFSMGAMQSVLFNCFGEHRIDGLAAISHLHDNWECRKALAKPVASVLFTGGLVDAMKRMVMKNPCIPQEDKHFRGVISPPTFDEVVGHKYRGDGPPAAQDAFSIATIYDKIREIRAPTLLIASHDDPMTLDRLLSIREVRASDKVALAHTKEGGHVGFLTGLSGRASIVDSIVPDFFDAIIRNE
jgi:predicted alpha/beta-fold hydrolase